MGWGFTDEIAVYIQRAWPLLAADPVEHILALTVIDRLRSGQRWSDEPLVLGWYQQGTVVSGAVLCTPPFELVLAVVPDGAVEELVATLRARQIPVPGVNGDTDLVDCFVKRWIAVTSGHVGARMHRRLYALGTLQPPTSLPAGGARLAGSNDFALVPCFPQSICHRPIGMIEVSVRRSLPPPASPSPCHLRRRDLLGGLIHEYAQVA